LKAIDLYCGIGGWSLGLEHAGVKVVGAYELWQPAITTYQNNLGTAPHRVDIRKLSNSDLPEGIDLVVGSPPCTQFSYSNRGGSGDVSDGLVDIRKFLEIVDFVKPKFWIMENVPRVARAVRESMELGGNDCLIPFRHLFSDFGGSGRIETLTLSDFGVPQKRKRCFIGNINFELLRSYRSELPRFTLGETLDALHSTPECMDLVYGLSRLSNNVTDNEIEPYLNPEECRLNRDSKSFHPVYNMMRFPEELDAPVRTITATCTRVSRESVVIEAPELAGKSRFRRLTVRERGILQGFPIDFQFFGSSYSHRLKMIGNALPPPMAYYIAQAIKGIKPDDLRKLNDGSIKLRKVCNVPKKLSPDQQGKSYPTYRRFRAAVPNLRFGSGVRYELANECTRSSLDPMWAIKFFFGPSKSYTTVELCQNMFDRLKRQSTLVQLCLTAKTEIENMNVEIDQKTGDELQANWNKSIPSLAGPFEIVDRLGELASSLTKAIRANRSIDINEASRILHAEFSRWDNQLSTQRLEKSGYEILAGAILASAFNAYSCVCASEDRNDELAA